MSWIRNHMRHYVVPGLKAIAVARRNDAKHLACKKKSLGKLFVNYQDRLPGLSLLDDVRQPVNMRPAKGFKNKELGLLWAAIKCFGLPCDSQLEYALRCGDAIALMPTLRTERFPNKEVPPQDQIHNIVKNSTKALRRILHRDPRRKLILPGRDVWLWSVVCHKLGIPHIFDARISRAVSRNSLVLKGIVDEWKIDEHTIIFDTGFAGSIYERIKKISGVRCTNLMLSTMRRAYKGSEQIFPNHKGARGKTLAIEYLPKYQKTGTTRDDKPIQYMADLDQFIKAAILTVWFWHHESPAWISQGEHRCKVVDCFCKSCLLWKGATVPVS